MGARCPRSRAPSSRWSGTSTRIAQRGALCVEGQRQPGALVQPPEGSRQCELLKKRVEAAAGRRAGARRAEGDRSGPEAAASAATTTPKPPTVEPAVSLRPGPCSPLLGAPPRSPARPASRGRHRSVQRSARPRLPEQAGRASRLTCPAVAQAFRPHPAALPCSGPPSHRHRQAAGRRHQAMQHYPPPTSGRWGARMRSETAAGHSGATTPRRPLGLPEARHKRPESSVRPGDFSLAVYSTA